MAVSTVQLNGVTLMTVNDTTATASDVTSGKYFYGADGVKTSGSGAEDREDLCEPLDVDFIDYDGRLLYSYTAQEFLALESLPSNPTNTGLTAQGWNWTLTDAKEFVGNYGSLVIGQNYTTNDGKTRIYITVPRNPTSYTYTINIWFTATVANGVNIIWGDGTSRTAGSTSNSNYSHEYSTPGNYMIELEVISGTITYFGRSGASNSIVGGGIEALTVRKVEIGNGITGLAKNAFGRLLNLETISIPTTLTTVEDYDEVLFNRNLKAVVFPSGFNTTRYRAMFDSYMMTLYISIPKSMHRISISTYPQKLRKLTIDSLDYTSLTVKLYNARSITHYVIGGTYPSIPTDSCRDTRVKKLFIPATVTSIAATALAYNAYCEEIHIYATTPPTLANVNAFNGTTGTFYVPFSEDHSILETYQTATNWSSFASRMVEELQ